MESEWSQICASVWCVLSVSQSTSSGGKRTVIGRYNGAVLTRCCGSGEERAEKDDCMADWLDAEQHANNAQDHFESGRWAEAEASLRRALDIDDEQPHWHHQLGVILELTGRDAEAVESFELATQHAPDDVEPHLAAASALRRTGDLSRSIDHYVAVTKLEPESDAAWAGLIEACASAGKHEDAEMYFYMSETALHRPSSVCLQEMGISLAMRASWKKAAWCLEESLRHGPKRGRACARLAGVYLELGREADALAIFDQLEPAQVVDPDVALAHADLLEQTGRYKTALEVLQRVMQFDPTNVAAHYQFGRLAMRAGQYQQAALAFQLVRRLDPNHLAVDAALGEAMLQLGQAGDARTLLASAARRMGATREITESSHGRHMLTRLSELLLRADLASDAARLLDILVRNDADSGLDRLRNLAEARFRAGDLKGGRAASRRVLRHDPTCVASIHNLALVSLLEERHDEAAAWIARGRAIDRRDEGLRQLRVRLLIGRCVCWGRRLLGCHRDGNH